MKQNTLYIWNPWILTLLNKEISFAFLGAICFDEVNEFSQVICVGNYMCLLFIKCLDILISISLFLANFHLGFLHLNSHNCCYIVLWQKSFSSDYNKISGSDVTFSLFVTTCFL